MPITNVTKITRKILPNNAKISDSAKEMIQQSATKFITFVTRKAKERCQSEYRKIMNVEDMLWAIQKLGFDDYVGPLTVFLQRYRDIERGDSSTYHPPLPPPVHSSGPNFSMDPNTNTEMCHPKW
uniref:Nuclear transcription factor Y subunit B-9 n=2 Tax=Cajanus cajan TaxID=3821 RepID=A0A151S4S0_CAJCA|nr:Nuclear transcription factor Y subunit B-9 [Cajanus cajan]